MALRPTAPTTGNKTRIDLKREAGAKTAAPSLEAAGRVGRAGKEE